MMKALQSVLAVLLSTAAFGAPPPGRVDTVSPVSLVLERLSHRGVFEGAEDIRQKSETSSSSRIDDRIRWLTFYLIYTDDGLSTYAPGGAMGARFDLFQFAGFPGSQPRGYPIHIVVSNARTTLIGVVRTSRDRRIAEARAREAAGVLRVDNALVVAHRENLP
jgi:hypothetical protein